MTTLWVKLPIGTYRRLSARLPKVTDQIAFYHALEEAKLAQSEGEWASNAEFAEAVGARHGRSRAALIAAGFMETTVEGWVRIVDWDFFTHTDPTSAERQKRWRDKQRTLRNASRNSDTVTDAQKERKIERVEPPAASSGVDDVGPPELGSFAARLGITRDELLGERADDNDL